MVSGASQLTLPFAVVVPVVPGWTVDAYGAYSKGEVRLATPDSKGKSTYSLDGPTDTRVRVVGELIGAPIQFLIDQRPTAMAHGRPAGRARRPLGDQLVGAGPRVVPGGGIPRDEDLVSLFVGQ